MRLALLFIFLETSTMICAQNPGAGVTDIDGNTYNTVIIGTQEWMSENLKTSSFANGETIPNETDYINTWYNLSSSAWIHFDNDIEYEEPYGKLYNWYAVNDSRKLCPTGWNIPTQNEWTILSDFLGGDQLAGGKLKTIGNQYWLNPNTNASNESGFSALPSGILAYSFDASGYFAFQTLGEQAYFWSSIETSNQLARFRMLWYNDGELHSINDEIDKTYGLSVRCLKNGSANTEKKQLPNKELFKVFDIMGRETIIQTNQIQIYIYTDGTRELVFKLYE